MMILHQLDNTGRLCIERLGAWRVAADAVLTLRCGGRVWITRAGDPDDHILQTGDRLTVRRGDRLIIEPWTAGVGALMSLAPLSANGSPPRVPVAIRLAQAGRALAAALRSASAPAGCS